MKILTEEFLRRKIVHFQNDLNDQAWLMYTLLFTLFDLYHLAWQLCMVDIAIVVVVIKTYVVEFI